MRTYRVYLVGRRLSNLREKLTASISAEAKSPQEAIQSIVKIDAEAFQWYSWTFRESLGYLSDVLIVSYEVEDFNHTPR